MGLSSPDPVASVELSGEKAQTKTASLWPVMTAVQRVTGRTLNTACGRCRLRVLPTDSVKGSDSTKYYGGVCNWEGLFGQKATFSQLRTQPTVFERNKFLSDHNFLFR